MTTIENLLETALRLAQKFDSDRRTGGAASVGLYWNPYQHEWRAMADWSSGTIVKVQSIGAERAVQMLIEELSKESPNFTLTP